MSVFKFKTIDEAIKRANDSDYGLASGVITENVHTANKVSKALKAGMCYVNGWALIQPQTSFGGFKQSGFGRELGAASLDGYLESKSVVFAKQKE